MPQTESIQINLIQPQFFFESHSTTFVEPSASQSYARSVAANRSDVAFINLASSLEIILTELEPGYTVLRPVPIKILRSDDSYIASFEDANIHASGETWSDAALSLKSLILDVYDSLITETSPLGPGPKRQLATLLRYVKAE